MTHRLAIHDAQSKQWLYFQDPQAIITAERIDQVIPQLQRVDRAVREEKLYGAGFISYEAAPAFDRALIAHPSGAFPLLWFGLYRQPEAIALPAPKTDYRLNWQPSVSLREYTEAIARIKDYIALGQTYQANYTLRLNAPFSGDPWELFLQLTRSQQADYGAYLDLDRFAICSVSPELFFQLSGQQLRSRPMKGTAARGRTLEEDREIAEVLYHSPKNRAENVMIVDMLRNDMGRVAKFPSVRVPHLFAIERYPTLWQMTSTVTATTRASLWEIIAALFPCASIVGAPKPRTMQIIRELETTPRGIYTGCIGFISPDREAQFNVAIRTVAIDKQTHQAEYGVGGGIVWDSTAREEYLECQIKARVLTAPHPEFSVLETILWKPQDGYFLLDYHLKRLHDSAMYFDIGVDRDEISQRLNAVARSLPPQPHKLRLWVDPRGKISWEVTPLPETIESQPIELGLSPEAIDSADPFLYHKTTHRQIYDRAKAACPDCDDVILWNENGEVTETCIGNVVIQKNGEFLTPPLRCGLLPGTFRAYLLDLGKIREAAILVEDLQRCDRIYRINSVRQWQEGSLISSP